MEKVLYILLIIIVIICLISIIICYIKIDINYFNIVNKKIDKDMKIVFLSDLHNRKIYDRLYDIVSKEKPDIVIFGGDMVNRNLHHIEGFTKLVDKLNNYNSFYTFGNHEEEMTKEDHDMYIQMIKKSSTILLNNTSDNITKNIKLYGLNPDLKLYKKFKSNNLNKEIIESYIGKINKDNFNILLSHNPLEFNSYVDSSFDLVLSGHIHGGVIKFPILGAFLSPNFTFFPKYYEGLYKKNNTSMIVSRGLGFSTKIFFRIFNHPEVIVINLKKK